MHLTLDKNKWIRGLELLKKAVQGCIKCASGDSIITVLNLNLPQEQNVEKNIGNERNNEV